MAWREEHRSCAANDQYSEVGPAYLNVAFASTRETRRPEYRPVLMRQAWTGPAGPTTATDLTQAFLFQERQWSMFWLYLSMFAFASASISENMGSKFYTIYLPVPSSSLRGLRLHNDLGV